MRLSTGDQLGPYEIAALIGEGGMGAVYRAVDTRMGRDVAIKLVFEQFSERFTREVHAIAALNHPHICTIYDVGPNYLVMEYLAGSPLKGPLPEPEAIGLAIQIGEALEAAHARGIVHRDLKPANIMVTSAGTKLLDFGLATAVRRQSAAVAMDTSGATRTMTMAPGDQSRAGHVVGTPAYMSPEQSEGKPVDPRSDIFAFGAVLYELLTGRRAFAESTTAATLEAIKQREPKPLEASSEVVRIVKKCLRKAPAERFQNMTELRLALENAATALPERGPSIAVLPFANTSAEKENEYFSDGLAEDVINALAGVPDLRVIARTSTFAFKNKSSDIRVIAEALGVSHVLEGSVRKSGGRIRVTAQLIAAEGGVQLWSGRYDRDLHDVFEIQDEIANAIVGELRVSLGVAVRVKPPTAHFAAYELVLQGRHHFYRFNPQDQVKSLACFERAIAIDPGYAAAHVGIALYHWGQMILGLADPRTAMVQSAAAARRALELDPASSQAHHILGSFFARFEFSFAEAETHFKRALALNPASHDAWHCYSLYYLVPLGHLDQALAGVGKALELNPLALDAQYLKALILEGLGDRESETRAIERIVQIDPNFFPGQFLLVRLRARQGRFEEAISLAEHAIQTAGRWVMPLAGLGIAHAMAGNVQQALDISAELQVCEGKESWASYGSLISAALGDYGAALDRAARSHAHRDNQMALFIRGSGFEPLRNDPRYAQLLRLMRA